MNAADLTAAAGLVSAVIAAAAGATVAIIRELRINRTEAASAAVAATSAAKRAARRAAERSTAIEKLAAVADQTHTMVNSQRAAAAAHTAILTAALEAAGVPVPPIAPQPTAAPSSDE